MDFWPNHQYSVPAICLCLSLLSGGATQSWAAGKTSSRPASTRRAAPPAKPVASVPGAPTVSDPCAPAASTMQTKAIGEPSRNSTSALASLVTRARSQEGPSPADANQAGPLALELWSSRILAPNANDDTETSLALKRLIRQVHSLALNEKSPAQAAPAPESESATPPQASVASRTARVPPTRVESAATTTPETAPALSAKAQKALEDLRKDPSRVRDPLETAELLFLSGRPTDATPFYEEALRRTRPGEAASSSDRAWILFQLGNCLRETDTVKAQDSYTKLIAEYPNSPWTEMARAGGRFLTWYQSTRPDQLMATRKP